MWTRRLVSRKHTTLECVFSYAAGVVFRAHPTFQGISYRSDEGRTPHAALRQPPELTYPGLSRRPASASRDHAAQWSKTCMAAQLTRQQAVSTLARAKAGGPGCVRADEGRATLSPTHDPQ